MYNYTKVKTKQNGKSVKFDVLAKIAFEAVIGWKIRLF